MNVEQVCKQLELHVLVGEDLSREVTGGYTGDLLSWVMARLPADAVWFTVMGNVNAIAVASLADAACIVLTDNASLDEEARNKAQQQDILVLGSEKNSYELGAQLAELLKK